MVWVQHRGRRKNPRETGGSGKGTGSKYILHTPKCFPQRQMFTKQSARPVCKCRGSLGYGNCRMTVALNIVQREKIKVAFMLSRCHKDTSCFFSTMKCMVSNPPRGFRALHMFPRGFTVQTLVKDDTEERKRLATWEQAEAVSHNTALYLQEALCIYSHISSESRIWP